MAFLEISPIIANPTVQTLGGMVYISTEMRSTAGVLTTPGTSYTIQITGPAGTITTAYTTMTLGASEGLFYYLFATAITDSPGKYSVLIKAVDGGNTSIARADFLFELVLSN